MIVDLDVIHSCNIKRKKPWPKVDWIGQDKQQIFLIDSQRVSIIDPKTGKTKKNPARIAALVKTCLSYNISDNGSFVAGIQTTGDVFIWHKDSGQVYHVAGMPDFARKLGSHCPRVFIDDQARKLILITSRNKVFVWESERLEIKNQNILLKCCSNNTPIEYSGNWSDIVASKEVKTVEDSKELALDVRFVNDACHGSTATCSFVFNYDKTMIVNILKIKWLNPLELIPSGKAHFETLWLCYEQPCLYLINNYTFTNSDQSQNLVALKSDKFTPLHTRGAYVIRLSRSADLLALACNQKYVDQNCLIFMSIANGNVLPVNLRNFGLKAESRGRHYWIQELNWTFNDLYLVGITKHGAIFMISRLGVPLFIHALGSDINMGPALYLTLHPLIVVRNNNWHNTTSVGNNTTLNTTAGDTNDDIYKQRYSIISHPVLPVLICSDGYLMCVLQIKSSYSTQPRLIRELMHEAIGLLNSATDQINASGAKLEHLVNEERRMRKSSSSENESPLEWGLQTNATDKPSSPSDSGLEFEDKSDKMRSSSKVISQPSSQPQKVAEGKIVFSFMPQVEPLSYEMIETSSTAYKMETAFEYIQASWALLVSMSTNQASTDTHECDQTAKTIQQTFSHFSHLLLLLDSKSLQEFQIYQNEFESESELNFKLKWLIDLFMKLLHMLNFDPAASFNPASHMLIYIPRFVEKFMQSLIKFDFLDESKIARHVLLGLAYSLLSTCERVIKSIYHFKQDDRFFLQIDPVLAKKKPLELEDSATEARKMNKVVDFVDCLLEKCWFNLLHYAFKFKKMQGVGSELDMLTILIQRRIEQFPSSAESSGHLGDYKPIKYEPIHKKNPVFKMSKADIIYLELGDTESAINLWTAQLMFLFDKIAKNKQVSRRHSTSNSTHGARKLVLNSIEIAHKLFYGCLASYKLEKLVTIINSFFSSINKFKVFSPFELSEVNLFKQLQPPKPLPRIQPAILSLLKSLARFMALYLTSTSASITINSISNPTPMPSFDELLKQSEQFNSSRISLLKNKLTSCINSSPRLASFMTVDKTVEMFLSCGLFDEAIYFLNAINDWKSSFLVSSILKHSDYYRGDEIMPDETRSEMNLIKKVVSLLDIEQSRMMDKEQTEQTSLVLRELFVCSVLTKADILQPLLANLIEIMVKDIEKLSENSAIVPSDFYLPAPPIYCSQIIQNTQDTSNTTCALEIEMRTKICSIVKAILLVLVASNLHSALIKWYLKQLVDASVQMNEKLGVENLFTIRQGDGLDLLLSKIRYQKLGYIPDALFDLFRDFCALLFYLDMRDRFSLTLRQYKKHLAKNDEITATNQHQIEKQLGARIIEYGNSLLSYRAFLKMHHFTVQDIVLSTIARLSKLPGVHRTPNMPHLELCLAVCVEKQPINLIESLLMPDRDFTEYMETHAKEFENKLNKLVDSWRQIPFESTTDQGITSLAHAFEYQIKVRQHAALARLRTMYGSNEDDIGRVYIQKLDRSQPSICGGYDCERSGFMPDFLEMFFRLGIDHTEDWSFLAHSVKKIPLLPEFYEQVKSAELPDGDISVDKQYFMKPVNHSSHRKHDHGAESSSDESKSRQRQGLFRSYSATDLLNSSLYQTSLVERGYDDVATVISSVGLLGTGTGGPMKKSVSFSNLPISVNNYNAHEESVNVNNKNGTYDQNCSVLDFGPKYIQVTNLAIWLIKWADKFNNVLKTNSKVASKFLTKTTGTLDIVLRMKTLDANTLVASVYMADGNCLDFLSTESDSGAENSSPRHRHKNEDDLTQITYNQTSKIIEHVHVRVEKTDQGITEESTSSTLNISSLTEHHIPRLPSPRRQLSPEKSVSVTMVTNYNLRQQKQQSPIRGHDQPLSSPSPSQSTTADVNEFYSLNHSRQQVHRIPIEREDPVEQRYRPDSVQLYNGNLLPPISQPSLQPEIQPRSGTDVQSMIRDELKRIVQIQHDTVMSFLNGGNSAPPIQTNPIFADNNNIKGNLNQQLMSVFKQQSMIGQDGRPVEFVIETKIKTIGDGSSDVLNTTGPFNPSQSRENQPNYFMKTFPKVPQHHPPSNAPQKMSRFIDIPLLNMRGREKSPSPPRKCESHSKQQFTLIGFDRVECEKKNNKQSRFQLLRLDMADSKPLSSRVDSGEGSSTRILNKYVKTFVESTTSKKTTSLSSSRDKNKFQLLKLIDEDDKSSHRPVKDNTTPAPTDRQPTERSISARPSVRIEERLDSVKEDIEPVQLPEQDVPVADGNNKPVQVAKPLYDGFLLAPNLFEDLLKSNIELNSKLSEQVYSSSSYAHYRATQQLRENEKKRDMFTMTDSAASQTSAHPLPPNILLKLKFDQSKQTGGDSDARDFVNVADLDSNDVDDILKMIETDQSRRKKPSVVSETVTIPIQKENTDQSVNQSRVTTDRLTEQLFKNSGQMDESVVKKTERIEETTVVTNEKRRVTPGDELRAMDNKIRLMNEISSEMTSDYKKYSNIVSKLQEIDQEIEPPVKSVEIKDTYETIIEERSQPSEYFTSHQARDKIDKFKQRVEQTKTNSSTETPLIKRRKSVEFTIPDDSTPTGSYKTTKNIVDDLNDDSLSDMRDDEMSRVKKILQTEESLIVSSRASLKKKRASTPPKKQPAVRESVSSVLKDVFNDLNVSNESELMEHDKLDLMLELSSRSKSPRGRAMTTVLRPRGESKQSTPRSRREQGSIVHIERKISPIVQKERDMQEKREIMREEFMIKREQQAHELMESLLIDNYELEDILKHNAKQSTPRVVSPPKRVQPAPGRTKSKSPKAPIGRTITKPIKKKTIPVVKAPSLAAKKKQEEEKSRLSLEIAQLEQENKKPSLMAKTIVELARKESMKQAEAERVLKELDNRARQIARSKSQTNNRKTRVINNQATQPVRVIKSFTQMVRLQEPGKLRATARKPLTYTQQLMKLQEKTVNVEPNSDEIFKLYGTRRVPGVYQGYNNTNRRTKTYTERLKELVPDDLKTVVSRGVAPSTIKRPPIIRHDLKTKMGATIKSSAPTGHTRRYKPYSNKEEIMPCCLMDDKQLKELLEWSLDEKMKGIIYEQQGVTTIGRDMTEQDTLADLDEENLLELLEESHRYDDQDYVNQVSIDQLVNMSIHTDSASLSSYIDWDQIDNLINNL